ncbi:MAG: hypothetical protein F6K31_12245 [Symploca sp. SIO2G7]|nr:hypothetical protein [Symploca sp. SIO2G7]
MPNREHIQEEVSPEIAIFLETSQIKIGRNHRTKTIVDKVKITDKPTNYFDFKFKGKLSLKLEKTWNQLH